MRLIDAGKLLEGISELKQSPWFNSKYGYADRKEAVEIIEDLCIKKELIIKEPVIDAFGIVRCKDCKYFTLNLVGNVDGVPLIVAHEVCSFWGDGCKTSQEGFCSYGERREVEG